MRLHRLLIAVTAILSCLASLPSRADGPPPLPTLRMLNLWAFHPTNLSAGFSALPLLATNVERVASWSDEALQIDSAQTAWLRYRESETNGHANLLCTNGTVLFWFKPNWSGTNAGGSGPGTWARFLEVGTLTTNAAIGWWSLYLEPSGARLHLAAQANSNGAIFLECPVAWQSNVWHHVAVTYSPSNSALYLDGQWITNGSGISLVPGPQVRTNGFLIGSDSTGLAQMRGQMDWLQTFNEPMSAAGIANIFQARQPPGWQESLVIGGESELGMGTIGEGTGLLLDGGLDGGQMSAMSTYLSNELWLEAQPGSNALTVLLHNTGAGTNYLVYSRTNVASGEWKLEADVPGADGTTATVVPLAGRPSLFVVAGSGLDSDGDGLPDAYERWILHTDPLNGDSNTNGVSDGFEDADGDGWANQDEWSRHQDPGVFNTPPTLVGVVQMRDANDLNLMEWAFPLAASVTGFTVQRDTGSGWQTITNLPSDVTSFTDSSLPPGASAVYRISANYPAGSSEFVSTLLPPGDSGLTFPGTFARGPGGRLHFVGSQLPSEMEGFAITREPTPSAHPKDALNVFTTNYPRTLYYAATGALTGFLNATNLSNGPVRLSDGFLPYYGYYRMNAQVVGRDGRLGNASPNAIYDTTPFLDGRQHLLDNLTFVLRAGNASQQFDFYFPTVLFGEGEGAFYGMLSDHVAAGFNWRANTRRSAPDNFDPFRPFEDSSVLRAFCYSADRFDSQGNPFDVDFGGTSLQKPISKTWEFYFSSLDYVRTGNTNVPSRWLTPGVTQYLFHRRAADGADLSAIGLTWSDDPAGWTLASGARNLYGLPILSVRAVKQGSQWPPAVFTASPGQRIPAIGLSNAWFYVQTEMPILATSGCFVVSGPIVWLPYYPGHPNWTPTTQNEEIVMGLGQSLHMSAWARKLIVNGYTNKPAYLQLYYDKAYRVDTNGSVTSSETGVLSEYGDFFPTEPGRVALVTKPDLYDSIQVTSIVHVLELQLDVNHDGKMNGGYTGPDMTTAGRPFVFWANNDYDRGHNVDCTPIVGGNCDYEEDDLAPAAKDLVLRVPDYAFTYLLEPAHISVPGIPSMRDLEDYARLWTTGITNLLSGLPVNAVIELAWRSSSPTNPTIRLFEAAESDGGNHYLTDTNIALSQLGIGLYVGLVTPTTPLQLNRPGVPLKEKYLFCGAARGSGELVLRVRIGANILVQTSAYLQVKDIKEMYERWTAGDSPSADPLVNAVPDSSDLPAGVREFLYPYTRARDTNTPYILFVHGWNTPPYEKDRFAETAYKRLYWQGYQGRYGVFKWPTDFDFNNLLDVVFDFNNYDKSEFQSWKSGATLKRLLTRLNSRYPGQVRVCAHSMGNVVTGEALRQATTPVVATYVAMEAAVASHAYDPATPVRQIEFDNGTPDWHAHYWTPGDPCYFNTLPGAVTRINYYNTNDWALGIWKTDQDFKPTGSKGYAWDNLWGRFEQHLFPDRIRLLAPPQDTYEIFAFGVESRCFALGAQPGVAGVFSTASQIDLKQQFGFDTEHKYHSGQFRSSNMKRFEFWGQLLDTFGIATP